MYTFFLNPPTSIFFFLGGGGGECSFLFLFLLTGDQGIQILIYLFTLEIISGCVRHGATRKITTGGAR